MVILILIGLKQFVDVVQSKGFGMCHPKMPGKVITPNPFVFFQPGSDGGVSSF